MEGQQLSAVVSELGVNGEQAAVAAEVTEVQCELLLGAVHLAQIQEGRQGIDLLSPVRIPAKVIRRVPRSTSRGGSEGRDAAVRARGQAGVAGGDLCVVQKGKEDETRRTGWKSTKSRVEF